MAIEEGSEEEDDTHLREDKDEEVQNVWVRSKSSTFRKSEV